MSLFRGAIWRMLLWPFALYLSGSESSTDTSSKQTDNRNTQGDNGNVATGGSSVIVTNNVTSDRAFDIVDSVIGKSAGLTKDLTSQAFNSLNKTGDLVASAYADAKGRGAMTDTITLAALVGSALVAYVAIRKKA